MKKFFAAIVLAVFALVGCDMGSSAGPNDDPAVESSSSSSSVEQGSSSIEKKKKKKSSSSKNEESSSSVKLGSSSSVETPNSSSSELCEFSSSSADEVESSSSSVALATPCKTETEDNCEYGTLLDERDGQEYKTVKIGDQWWMAENLNYDDSTVTPSLSARSWCRDEVDKGCEVAGRLYTWAAAMDSVKTGCGYGVNCSPTLPVQGICPRGWHLPDSTEWETLFIVVGNRNSAGTALKTQSGWLDNNGTDAFGFSALPVGHGGEKRYGYSTIFWTATEGATGGAYYMCLDRIYEFAGLGGISKEQAFSVRCVKD